MKKDVGKSSRCFCYPVSVWKQQRHIQAQEQIGVYVSESAMDERNW